MTGWHMEYATFWEKVYGISWSPSARMPVWADACGRMRMFSKGNPFMAGGTTHVEYVD